MKPPRKRPAPSRKLSPIVEATSAAMVKFFDQTVGSLTKNTEKTIAENTSDKDIQSAVDRLTLHLIRNLEDRASNPSIKNKKDKFES